MERETIRHEAAYLVEAAGGPILVYVIEAEDLEQADRAFTTSSLAIDHEHRAIMQEVIDEPFPAEQLLDLRR